MAPEQLSGEEVTARSDLYALGLVLFEIFTGKKAFPASSEKELKELQKQGAPNRPTTPRTLTRPSIT